MSALLGGCNSSFINALVQKAKAEVYQIQFAGCILNLGIMMQYRALPLTQLSVNRMNINSSLRSLMSILRVTKIKLFH